MPAGGGPTRAQRTCGQPDFPAQVGERKGLTGVLPPKLRLGVQRAIGGQGERPSAEVRECTTFGKSEFREATGCGVGWEDGSNVT